MSGNLPTGVILQAGGNIRIRWWHKGVAFCRTLDLPHTDDGIIEAALLREKYAASTKQAGGWCHAIDADPREFATLDAAYNSAFRAAKKRREYTITAHQKQLLIRKAAGRCQLTGIPFNGERHGGHKAPFAPSLDRINSSQHYDYTNVRLVCVAANFAMNQWGEPILKALAEGYVQTRIFDMKPAHVYFTDTNDCDDEFHEENSHE